LKQTDSQTNRKFRHTLKITKKKNALSYGGASSTVGDRVLFERKAITTDCFIFKKFS